MTVEITKIESQPKDKYNKLARVYVWPEKYNPIEDMVSGVRYNRPEQAFKPLIASVLAAMGAKEPIGLRWSQFAGCTCRCSPGFVVEGESGRTLPDVHITYKEVAV